MANHPTLLHLLKKDKQYKISMFYSINLTSNSGARVNSKRGGYVSKHIAMLYELRKKKRLMNKVDVKDKN